MNDLNRLIIEIEIKQLFITFMIGLFDNYSCSFDSQNVNNRLNIESYVNRMPLLQ